MDDVLVFGRTKAEHDKRLFAVLQQIQKAGITLNTDKCEFWCDKLTFLGHIVSKQGISPDPAKIIAIEEMDPPTNVTEVRRFLGILENSPRELLNFLALFVNSLVPRMHGLGATSKKNLLRILILN